MLRFVVEVLLVARQEVCQHLLLLMDLLRAGLLAVLAALSSRCLSWFQNGIQFRPVLRSQSRSNVDLPCGKSLNLGHVGDLVRA